MEAAPEFRPVQTRDEAKEEIHRAFTGGDISKVRTLDEWIYIWIREVVPQAVKLSTIRMYADTLDHHVQPYIGGTEMESLSSDVFQKWINQMRE